MLARSENWPARRKPHAPMFSLPVPVLHILEPSLPGFRITDLPMTKYSMIGHHRHAVVPDTHAHAFTHGLTSFLFSQSLAQPTRPIARLSIPSLWKETHVGGAASVSA
jgi:hypothetical protein